MCNMDHNDGKLTIRASNMKQIEPELRENEAGAQAGRTVRPEMTLAGTQEFYAVIGYWS